MYALSQEDILFSAIVAAVACLIFIGIWFYQYKTEGLLISPKKDPRCIFAWFIAIASVALSGWLAIHFFSML